ncbi:MAG: 2-hydroxyacid dehydrogenase [bacterium]|jgi:D-3-phosphoglycerate dehydrogenase
MKAYITAPFTAEGAARIGKYAEIAYGGWGQTQVKQTPEQMAEQVKGADILIVELDPVTAEVIEAGTELKLIGCCRGNPVNVDIRAATDHGIPVLYTPARNAYSVAEMVVCYMIMLARNVEAAVASLRRGEWGTDGESPYLQFRGSELWHRKVGIIGLGAVGRLVAERLRAFDMEVLAFDPYLDPAVAAGIGVKTVDLETLLHSSDFVTVHVNVTPETKGLLGAPEIALMKQTAYLINTSRSAVVSEEAVYRAAAGRMIAGAALDVFDREPINPDNPLLGLPNVLLTPHICGATDDVVAHHSLIMAENVAMYLEGKQPRFVANPEVLK